MRPAAFSAIVLLLAVWGGQAVGAQRERAPAPSWRFVSGGRVSVPPALDHRGILYFPSADGFLYSVFPSGLERWRTELPARAASEAVIAYAGTVLLATEDGELLALSPSGRLRWRFRTGQGPAFAPAFSADGAIYLATREGTLFSLSYSGQERWRYRLRGEISAAPAVGPDGTVYVGSTDRRLLALAPDGARRWEVQLPGAPARATIGEDGSLYVSAFGLHRVDRDGLLIWSYSIAGRTTEAVIAADGDLLLGSSQGKLYRISPEGEKVWDLELGAPLDSAAAVSASGRIYVAAGRLYTVSVSGERLSSFAAKKALAQPALAPDGSVYAGSEDWILYALRADSGGPAASPWPVGGHDREHSGRSGALLDAEGPAALVLEALASSESRELKARALDTVEAFLTGKSFLAVGASTLERVLGRLATEGATVRTLVLGAPAPGYPGLRSRACALLGRLATEGARQSLLTVLRHETDPTVQAAALEALAAIGIDPDGAALKAAEGRLAPPVDEGFLLAALDMAVRFIENVPLPRTPVPEGMPSEGPVEEAQRGRGPQGGRVEPGSGEAAIRALPAGPWTNIPAAYRLLVRMAGGPYSRRVKERAARVLASLIDRDYPAERRWQ